MESRAEGNTQVVGHLYRGRTAGIRDRNDDVDVVIRPFANDLAGQLFAHAQSRFVDGQVVDNRIGPREIHELENTR